MPLESITTELARLATGGGPSGFVPLKLAPRDHCLGVGEILDLNQVASGATSVDSRTDDVDDRGHLAEFG